MPKKPLAQSWFTYSTCGTFTKNRNQNKKQKNKRYIHQNKLSKACFLHDMACGAYKDLPRRTHSEIALWNKAFSIASNPLVWWVATSIYIDCL